MSIEDNIAFPLLERRKSVSYKEAMERTVAELTDSPLQASNRDDPTGRPSAINCSTSVFRRVA